MAKQREKGSNCGEAEKAIEELKSMGEEWASWEYRVVEYK